MKIKGTAQMCPLEQSVMRMIYNDAKDIKDGDVWRRYERGFIYEGKKYKVKCLFKLDNKFLTHKNLVISHDTQLIQIPQAGHLH